MPFCTTTPNEQNLTDGLFIIEAEERLEMIQLTTSAEPSCCGDSGPGGIMTDPVTGLPTPG